MSFRRKTSLLNIVGVNWRKLEEENDENNVFQSPGARESGKSTSLPSKEVQLKGVEPPKKMSRSNSMRKAFDNLTQVNCGMVIKRK